MKDFYCYFLPLTASKIIPRLALLGTSVNVSFAFTGTVQLVISEIFVGENEGTDEELRNRSISWVKTMMGATQEYVVQVPATTENNETMVYLIDGFRVTDIVKVIVVSGESHCYSAQVLG